MNPCFIHGYESTQKISFIAVKHYQTLNWSILTTLFLFLCEQTRHPSCTQLFHVQIFSQYAISACFEMPTMVGRLCTFSLRLSNTILWIFLTVSVIVTLFAWPLRSSSWKLHWEKKHGEINGKEYRRQFHVGVALLSRRIADAIQRCIDGRANVKSPKNDQLWQYSRLFLSVLLFS